MARPRKPIDSDRRGALMREARSSFARLGYAGTSLSSVLRASGFPRSSFYYFFDGKEALLDEAFADGLSRLAVCAPPPDPGALTAETFWPRLFGFVDALAEAGTDPDLAATARLFHMSDAPASARRASFERGARRWCAEVVRAGRRLGAGDEGLDPFPHVLGGHGFAGKTDRHLVRPGARDHFLSARQGTHGPGDSVQRRGPSLLLAFAAFPDPAQVLGHLAVTEDVGVAADQFVRDAAGDVVDGEPPLVLRDPGVEVHLEQQVAEFLAQVVVGAVLHRVDHLAGFLDEVGQQRGVRLLPVPRAFDAQPRHHLVETDQLLPDLRHQLFASTEMEPPRGSIPRELQVP